MTSSSLCRGRRTSEITAIVAKLRELPVNVYLGADLVGFRLPFRPPPDHFGELPLVEVMGRPLAGWGGLQQGRARLRARDHSDRPRCCPLMALIALAIKLDSRGPVDVPAGALRLRQPGVSHLQVPHHAARSDVRADATEEASSDRAGDARRSRGDPGRALPAALEPRRAAATPQCAERNHVAGRAAAACGRSQRGLCADDPRLFRAPSGQAGHHRLGAGQRASEARPRRSTRWKPACSSTSITPRTGRCCSI